MRSIQTAVQIDSEHWLVIFIHENGIVSRVMDRDDFINLITTETQVGH